MTEEWKSQMEAMITEQYRTKWKSQIEAIIADQSRTKSRSIKIPKINNDEEEESHPYNENCICDRCNEISCSTEESERRYKVKKRKMI